MKKNFIILLCLVSVGLVATVSSCLKKEFDAPPNESSIDPQLKVTHTIAQLKEMPQSEITDDVVIAGIVCMDDRSGNYYKKIVVQDETGGIEIEIDQTNLYTDYPVGRKVYIRCKGLFLGNYFDLPQLGSAPDERGSLTQINGTMVDDYIVKATFPNTIKVDTVNYSDLASIDDSKVNKLVAIRDVQFAEGDAGAPYSAPGGTTNRNLTDCSFSGGIVIRTSNYAKFQSYAIPNGSGTILALYTRYRTTPQLIIRDTSDVRFYHPRCQ